MTDRAGAVRRWRRAELAIAMILVADLVVACLRASRLKPYWADEIFSWVLATQESPARMLRAIAAGTDTTPPLYHLLAWGWMRFGVPGDAWLRLFTSLALAGSVVWLLTLLARHWGTVAAAVGVVATTLVSGLFLYQNTEARFYGLYPLVFVAALAAALPLVRDERPTGRALVLNAVAQAALAYVHVFGPLYGAVLFAAVAWPDLRTRRPRWAVWGSFVAGWAAFALWLPALLNHMAVGRPESWVPLPRPQSLGQMYTFQVPSVGLWFALLLHAAARLVRESDRPDASRAAYRLGLAGTLAPVMPMLLFVSTRRNLAGWSPDELAAAMAAFAAGSAQNVPWLLLVLVLGVLHLRSLGRPRDDAPVVAEPAAASPVADGVRAGRGLLVRVGVLVLLVPPLVYVVSHGVTSIFVRRYMLPTTFAMPILVAAAIGMAGDPAVAWRRRGGRLALAGLSLLALVGLTEPQRFAGMIRPYPVPAMVAAELAPPATPIATQDMFVFLQGVRYLGADTSRLALLLDSTSVWRAPRRRGATVEFKLMRHWREQALSGRIADADAWLCRHPRFLFVETLNFESPLLRHDVLRDAGWLVRHLRHVDYHDYYLVERRPGVGPACRGASLASRRTT